MTKYAAGTTRIAEVCGHGSRARLALAALMAATALLGACASNRPQETAAAHHPMPMTLAGQRLAEAGGPSERSAQATANLVAGSPVGRDWIFTWIDGYDGPLPSPPPIAGFIMTTEAGLLTGTTACNRMSSGYELNVAMGTLRFTGLRNTRMLCDRVASDTEEAVLAAMIATDGFRLTGGTLELLSDGAVIARLVTPEP